MGRKLTAWGGAYLAGFLVLGLIQKNYGFRTSSDLDAAAALIPLIALIALFAASAGAVGRVRPQLLLAPSAALCAALGAWWGARHSGLPRTYKAVAAEATVLRRQPFSLGFNPWPHVLVATAHRQFAVRGRFRPGERGWLTCPVAGLRGEPCRFQTVAPRRFRPHPIKKLADRGIRRLSRSIAAVRPKSAARFYRAVLLAKPRQLSAATAQSFKNLGIYHLLVTSGLHFAILLGLFKLIFSALLRAAYCATLISPYRWFFCRRLSVVASFGLLFGYGLGLGLPAPVTRCLFMVGISQVLALSWWPLAVTPRLIVSLVAATVIFPLGFLSSGSLLSWGCTLLLCVWAEGYEGGEPAAPDETQRPSESQGPRSQGGPLTRYLLWQGQLVLLSLLLIGSFTPLAWLTNGLIAAAFAPLLITGFGLIAGHALLGLTTTLGFAGSLAQQFLALVSTIDSWLPLGLAAVPMRTPLAQLSAELVAVAVCGLTWYGQARR